MGSYALAGLAFSIAGAILLFSGQIASGLGVLVIGISFVVIGWGATSRDVLEDDPADDPDGDGLEGPETL